MTKRHFILMAALVADILAGKHPDTSALSWIDQDRFDVQDLTDTASLDTPYYREACIVAHACLTLGKASNPCFDERRFLQACGLIEMPAKPLATKRLRKSRNA